VGASSSAAADTPGSSWAARTNPSGVYSITAAREHDGSIVVRFGDHGADAPNAIPIMDGWNCLIRLYRPRAEILDGTWKFPTISR
jgi:hypothetical protein